MEDCIACKLTNGEIDLPGGRIYATKHWVVEHCVGPLGVGTLIVKPVRHSLSLWQLTDEEADELGPLLRLVATVIRTILEPDQVYVCQWSHADWKPGHLHFVVQPSWNRLQKEYEKPGPFLQVDMFEADEEPQRREIEEFSEKARTVIQRLKEKRI